VTAGQPHTIQYRWAGGNAGLGWNEVGVCDGALTSFAEGTYTNLLGATARKNNLQDWSGFNWESKSYMFTPSGSTITIFVKTGRTSTDDPIATWVDEMVLVQGTPSQHEVYTITPPNWRDNSDLVGAVVTGLNLTNVTAVKLVRGATTIMATGVTIAGDGQ